MLLTPPTPAQQQSLIDAARAAMRVAYAPYSGYLVGASVLDENGQVHLGCNVENVAYPQGVCAEAGALSAMVLAGGRKVRAVAVAAAGGAWVTPCGGCRQKLREFCDPETPVFTVSEDQSGPTYTVEQLLPHSFGPAHLTQR